VAGSVSGGCIDDDLIDKTRAGMLATGVPRVMRYSIDGGSADERVLTEATLATLHGPSGRMLVIGAGQMPQALLQMSQVLSQMAQRLG
jgi:xanthine/CO dehydrogenase XdhC/CoxF family maturation factor